MESRNIKFGSVRSSPIRTLTIVAAVLIGGIWAITTAADLTIEYDWWKEIGQASTWTTMLWYSIVPVAIGAAVAFAALWVAHERGLHFAGIRRKDFPSYSWLIVAILAVASMVFSSALIDYWTVLRFVGSRGLPAASSVWKDPVFARALPFYFFDLPFYTQVLAFVFVLAILSVLVFWATARGWQLWLRGGFGRFVEREPPTLFLPGATRTGFIRVISMILLLGVAGWVILGNYDLLFNAHPFMIGADYVDAKIALPLRWLLVIAILGSIPLVWLSRFKTAIGVVVAFFALQLAVPGIVRAVYVSPNEISIERPYIQRHIEATNAAFALERNATEQTFTPTGTQAVDPVQDATLLDNVRLWDLRAYNAAIDQIQALRPYYTFPDTDVDRYVINGEIKQVLLSPREIEVSQLSSEASQSWINPHFIYTHGFGVVVAEVNKMTSDGLPVFLVENSPPEIKSPGFKLSQPRIYYGESTQDPVFVHTTREEFDYPAGDENKYSTYDGSGGFPVSSFFVKLAAAISEGQPNIIFTSYLTGQSRMMIHRKIEDRLATVAPFLHWDQDPYLVDTDDGRLVWMADAYTTSLAYPYAATLPVAGLDDGANYIRNAVKATVDAYTGKINLYVFDPTDPIIQTYEKVFPNLFQPFSAMPADLRRHARYPEDFFRVQAEAYRTFHMHDPQVFYNKEDVWDIAHSLSGQSDQPAPMQPTYVVATLPGEKQAEFLLILPFTPRGKDNLIGWMAARCDGDHLGDLVYYELSKQQLMYGPMQIESRIDQDQNISKDLSLWNQQGSRVLRGSVIALPVSGGFLYVESIYIQAQEARMPQLKKVVLAMGDRLIYRDNFDEALADLTGSPNPLPVANAPPAPTNASAAPAAANSGPNLSAIADSIKRLRQQSDQLTHELDDLEKQIQKK